MYDVLLTITEHAEIKSKRFLPNGEQQLNIANIHQEKCRQPTNYLSHGPREEKKQTNNARRYVSKTKKLRNIPAHSRVSIAS
jgi:hypothetical protein